MARPRLHGLRVATGLSVLGLFVTNVVVVEGVDGVTLVDAGAAATVPLLRGRLRALGYGFEDVRRVLVTHAHPDHVGGLPALVAAGAEVWASDVERAWVEGRGKPPLPAPTRLPLVQRVLARLPTPVPTPVPVARSLGADESLDEVRQGLRTVLFPGHTPGQMGYAFEVEGVLVAGDALMHVLPWWHPPLQAFTSDVGAAFRSAEAIVARDPRVLIVGHGPPATARAGRSVAAQVRGALARFPADGRMPLPADAPRR